MHALRQKIEWIKRLGRHSRYVLDCISIGLAAYEEFHRAERFYLPQINPMPNQSLHLKRKKRKIPTT